MRKIICQPYYNYEGHFRHYTKNLEMLYDEKIVPKAVDKLKLIPNKKSLIKFLIWKTLLSFCNYFKLIKINENAVVHIVDFEPIAYFILSPLISRKIKIIITIHAAAASAGLSNKLYKVFLYYVLSKISKKFQDFLIIVHDLDAKKVLLSKLPRINVNIINYPGIDLKLKKNKQKNDVVIYGALRQDKDPVEILKMCNQINQRFLHAGRVDKNIEKFMGNIEYSNKYVTDKELKKILESAKYLLMPYGRFYVGGAGPLKDAIVNSIPIIAHKKFRYAEFILDKKIGYVFSTAEELVKILKQNDEVKYNNLVNKLEDIKHDYTWDKMKSEYENILRGAID